MPWTCGKMCTINTSFQFLPFVCHSSLKSAVLNYKPDGFLQTHYGLLLTFMVITGIISIWIPKYNSRTSHNNDAYFRFFYNCFVLWDSLFSFSLVFGDAKHPLTVHFIVRKFMVPHSIRSFQSSFHSLSKLLSSISGHSQSERKI